MNHTRIFLICLLLYPRVSAFAQATPEERADTSLTPNKIVRDSLTWYKEDRDFEYISYLDSLLRQEKDLRMDTFNINAGKDRTRPRKERNSVPISLQNNFLDAPAIKIFLWILAVFFISFLLYKIFFSEGFFRKNKAIRSTVTEKEEEQVHDSIAYNRLIEQAVLNKNFRLAVRYLYLQTLQMLSERGLIHLSADKTNYEYVRELTNNSHQDEFSAVTLGYEYTWYGKFEIGKDIYDKLSGSFKLLQQKL